MKAYVELDKNRKKIVTYENENVVIENQSYYEPGLTHPDQIIMAVDYHHANVTRFSYDGKKWHVYGGRV